MSTDDNELYDYKGYFSSFSDSCDHHYIDFITEQQPTERPPL